MTSVLLHRAITSPRRCLSRGARASGGFKKRKEKEKTDGCAKASSGEMTRNLPGTNPQRVPVAKPNNPKHARPRAKTQDLLRRESIQTQMSLLHLLTGGGCHSRLISGSARQVFRLQKNMPSYLRHPAGKQRQTSLPRGKCKRLPPPAPPFLLQWRLPNS